MKTKEILKETPESQLQKLIPQYGECKSEMDALKKVTDKYSKNIKNLFSKLQKDSLNVGEWNARVQERPSYTFDEDSMIEFMKTIPELNGCVCTKEYVNWDELEKLLYAGKVDDVTAAKLDQFKTTKITTYLYVTKTNEKQNKENG